MPTLNYAATSISADPPRPSTARKANGGPTSLPGVHTVSQTEIGKKLGLPQRKVSRVIASAVKNLKDKISRH